MKNIKNLLTKNAVMVKLLKENISKLGKNI
jgi:hypothetical protein